MKAIAGRALHLFTGSQQLSKSIWAFCLPLFFLLIADSAMSYIFPIVVKDTLNSNTLLGIIMALSSIVGFMADFTFPQLLKNKTWKFQILAAIVLAILFPISLTLGSITTLLYLFILGSVIWGIYFEFMSFSQQSFILDQDKSGDYSKDWGILYLVYQTSTVIGPILGSLLLSKSMFTTNVALTTIQIFALIFALIIIGKFPNKNIEKPTRKRASIKETLNIIREAKYWNILSRSVWPVVILGITVCTINAVFWTIGGLFGQELFAESGLDWIVIVLFSGPTIVGSLILTRVVVKHKKKHFSQIFLILGSAFLCMLYFAKGSTIFILLIISFASFALSFVGPLNDAVYSDLLDRLKKDRLHLMGMAKANSSIAFIIGPLFAGFLADKIDYLLTFSIIGVVGLAVGILLLIFTPKKIKLKQQEITQVQ